MKNKNWIKIASIYIGTVIGAGFASGREIVDFFGAYGVKGIWGIIISGILFSLLGSLLLIKIHDSKIEDFNGLVNKLFGKGFGFIIDTIISFSLYTGFSIMISGSGAIFKEELGLPFDIGVLIMASLSFIVFLFSLKGLSFVNTLLVPLLIIGIIFTSFYLNIREGFVFSHSQGVDFTGKGNFITSSLLYFGSNCLIIIVVFSSLLPLIDDRGTAIIGGSVGGFILAILALSIFTSMLIYYNEVFNLEIPMLRICDHIGEGYRKLYAIILWIAMFTTALANGFGFMDKINKNKLLNTAFFCISAIPLAKVGFANLVGIIYPISGIIGFVMMVIILLH
ncbi:MAG: hypothetical protein GXY88_00585 [Tissierellia bacterium]|nr:hypothetical protein [Tissierellia bacterium]